MTAPGPSVGPGEGRPARTPGAEPWPPLAHPAHAAVAAAVLGLAWRLLVIAAAGDPTGRVADLADVAGLVAVACLSYGLVVAGVRLGEARRAG